MNFVVAPIVVAAMFFLFPADQAVRLGMLLVVLAPCGDYVIVFSGLAGGDKRRLLAATPLLLIAQTLLLPVFLVLFLGSGQANLVQIGPFLHAFLFLIVIPLALAWTTQAWGRRHRAGIVVSDACGTLMAPLMSATLLVVVGSQVPKLNGNVRQIASVIPFYIAFLIVMPLAGWAVATMLRLDIPGTRAIAFTAATRNSLVVLPLALALPSGLAIAVVVIVTQTLVEIIGMVTYVLIPRLIPRR